MGHTRLAELRNAPEETGAAIRKKDPLELEEFLKQWQFQLRTKGTGWEEGLAVAELQRKKLFAFLLCEQKSATAWQGEDLFSRILSEMRVYRQEAGNRLAREYFDDVDEFLKKELRRIQQQEDRASIRELKSILKKLRKEIERTQKIVGWLKERKKNWHFGVWQDRWPDVKRKNLVSRKLELDTRLQVELGKMFADYLRPKVKLETIARLILFAYCVGRLADLDGEEIRASYTGRVLKVRNIRDNLREARVHKQEFNNEELVEEKRATKVEDKKSS